MRSAIWETVSPAWSRISCNTSANDSGSSVIDRRTPFCVGVIRPLLNRRTVAIIDVLPVPITPPVLAEVTAHPGGARRCPIGVVSGHTTGRCPGHQGSSNRVTDARHTWIYVVRLLVTASHRTVRGQYTSLCQQPGLRFVSGKATGTFLERTPLPPLPSRARGTPGERSCERANDRAFHRFASVFEPLHSGANTPDPRYN